MAAVLAPVSLANLMFTFGLPEALNYHVARRLIGLREVRGVSLVGGFVAGSLAALIIWLTTPVLLRDYPHAVLSARLIGLTLPVTIAFAAFRGAWQGMRCIDRINGERILGVLARLVTLVVFVALGVLTPVRAAWITVIAGIVGSLVLLQGLRLGTPRTVVPLRRVGSFAVAAGLGTIGGLVVLRLDQTVMVPLAGARELGYYAVAVSLAELPIAFIAGVRDTIATIAADSDEPAVAARSARMTTLLLLPLCLAGALVAPWILRILFGAAFEPATTMTRVLFLGCTANGVAAMLGAGLMALGRPVLRSICQAVCAVVTVPLLFLLVPPLGGLGAAITTTSTYCLLAALLGVLFARGAELRLRDCFVPARADVESLRSWAVSRRGRLGQ